MVGGVKYPRQLLLDLDVKSRQTFRNFIAGRNRLLIDFLQSMHPLEQNYSNSVYCWAEESCGKSHLLRAYCAYWQEEGVLSYYFNGENLPSRDHLESYSPMMVVAFDNVQALMGNAQREEDLLFLLQRCHDEDVPLLLSANKPPQVLHCALEDLATRLASFFVFRVKPLDAESTQEFVVTEAKKLGLSLSERIQKQIHQSYAQGDMKILSQLLRRLAATEADLSLQELARQRRLLNH